MEGFALYCATRQLDELFALAPQAGPLSIHGHQASATFAVEGQTFDFEANTHDGRTWVANFTVRMPQDGGSADYYAMPRNSGGRIPSAALGTALQYMRQLATTQQPQRLVFNDPDTARRGLHQRLLTRFAAEIGYTLEMTRQGFVLNREARPQPTRGGYTPQPIHRRF